MERLKNFLEDVFSGDRLKNFCEDLIFFGKHLRLCPWPWPRAFLSLASRVSVLGSLSLTLASDFFVSLASSLVYSTPPLPISKFCALQSLQIYGNSILELSSRQCCCPKQISWYAAEVWLCIGRLRYYMRRLRNILRSNFRLN